MGCNISKSSFNDELDGRDYNIKPSSSYSNSNNYGINEYFKYIEELEQTINNYIPSDKNDDNNKAILSVEMEKKLMDKIKTILKEMRLSANLEETKIDCKTISYDKKVICSLNLFRKHFTSLYYKMEQEINKTLLFLNEREIFIDVTDDELSPEASSHTRSNTPAEPEDSIDDDRIHPPPPPPPLTPRFKKSCKKAQWVDQSKTILIDKPIAFYKLTGDISSSSDTRTARTVSTDSTDYGFIDLDIGN